ncbi:MAG: PEP-CTERM sorting domain-containing protein [Phycisphaerales bacterium]
MKARLILGAAAVAMIAGTASAEVFVWDHAVTPADGTNNAAGIFESIHAEFDTVTNRFQWNATFSNQVTRGYTLAVSPGPNPKGHNAELALLYFDASTLSAPKVTAYAYNGANAFTSWQDGNGNQAGNQAPDLIHGINNTSWIQNASVVDAGGKRTFNLTIDASTIQNHVPLYNSPAVDGDWTGLAFGPSLGLWMHSFTGLSAGYLGNGALCGWDYNGSQGWFDGNNYSLVLVPLPAPAMMGIAGLGVAGFVVRKRKAALAK